MSFLAYDDVDGVFSESDAGGTDSPDGTARHPVIHVTVDADIPTRYYVCNCKIFSTMQDATSSQSIQRQSEKPARYRLVHKSWGSDLKLIDQPSTLALVTVDNDKLNQDNSRSVVETISDTLQGRRCEIVRYDPTHILVHFPDQDGCQALGQAFLDEKLDDVDGFKVIDIEPSVLTNPPQAFFEVETSEPVALSECLVNIISPFSTAFTYLTVRHSDDANMPVQPSPAGVQPALCVTLLFHGKSQKNANMTLKRLGQPPWRPVQLPDPMRRSLDNKMDLFQNTEFSVPMLGVKTGCAQSGIQLTILVQDKTKFNEMEKFYRHLFSGLEPASRHPVGSEVQYCVFPMSQKAELVIAYYPGIEVNSLKNSSIYIQVSDVSNVQGIIKISADHWHLNDPEGNRVVLFIPLK